jgi:iron complex transport system substrate-binding protein
VRTPADLFTRPRLAALAAASLLLVTAGCGDSDHGDSGSAQVAPTPSASEPAEPAEPAFPVTIEHALGTTTISEQPQRVIALSFEEDALAAVGVTPIAYGQNAYQPDDPAYPWLEGRVDLTASTPLPNVFAELNLEQLAELAPDLILATNFYGLEQYYEQLRKIAPTVGYDEEAGLSPWQDVAEVIGAAVGDAAAMDEAIADTESAIAAVRDELPGLAGQTFTSSFYYAEGQPLAVIDDPSTTAVTLYQDLGLVLSPDLAGVVTDRSLSMENLDAIDADYVSVGYESEGLRSELEGNPLFAGLGAVEDGRYVAADGFTAQTFNNPTILNIPWQLEQIRPVLEAVAGG